MQALRAALGIPPEVYTDFAQLRRKVLEKAKSEIDQLAHFRVEWREIRQGRTVTELEFRFEPKGAPEVIETVAELDRHSAGRHARREGTVETIAAGQGGIPGPSKAVASRKPPEASFPRVVAALRGHRVRIPLDRQGAWRGLGCGYDRRWLSLPHGCAIGKAAGRKVDGGMEGFLRGLG